MTKQAKAPRARKRVNTTKLDHADILFRGHGNNYLHINNKAGTSVVRVPVAGGFRRKSDVQVIKPNTNLIKTSNSIQHLDATETVVKTIASKAAGTDDIVLQPDSGWVLQG